jgi:hypothetical protein
MKPYLPIILVFLAHSSMLAAANEVTQRGKDLAEQAEKKANIFELPSFEISEESLWSPTDTHRDRSIR